MNGVARQRRKSCQPSILLSYKKMVRADVSISVYHVCKGTVFFTENKGLMLEFTGDQRRIPTEGTQDQMNVFWKVLFTSKESHVIKKGGTSREGLCGTRKGWMEQRNIWNTGTDAWLNIELKFKAEFSYLYCFSWGMLNQRRHVLLMSLNLSKTSSLPRSTVIDCHLLNLGIF